MVRDYELMYIVRPDVDEDGLRAAVDSVRSLIEGQGGEIRKTTNWGKRRLAYEVKHLRDGHYVIVEMRLDGGRVAEIERALRIHDAVFRHLLVVQEEPSADTGEEGEGTEAGFAAPAVDADTAGETSAPTAETPDAETPEVETPAAETPDVEAPAVEAADTDQEETDDVEPAGVGADDEEA